MVEQTTGPADDARWLHGRVLDWYDAHQRDLPWRRDGATAWEVVVSELMLQQTPVARVLPVWTTWVQRWPTPASLAQEPAGEAVRAWGRLGYPRRALRLHAAALAMVERHGGEVPSDLADLLALPGIGDYTAAAVASFAFGQRHVVLDTNVRRVLQRALGGRALPPPAVTRSERDRATGLLPDDPATAATWAVAVMELGALVCTARRPRCESCPLREECRWRALGHPADDTAPRRVQTYDGTDRQCRGRLLAVLRESPGSVSAARLDAAWSGEVQRERALRSLLLDGLVVRTHDGRYALP